MVFTIKLLLPSAVGSAAREAPSAGWSLSPVHLGRDKTWAWGLAGAPLRPVFLLSKKAFLTSQVRGSQTSTALHSSFTFKFLITKCIRKAVQL